MENEEIKEVETVVEEANVEVQADAITPAEKTEKEYKRPAKRTNRRKVCAFCVEKAPIDYKDVPRIKRFISENGKILPRRQTGTCSTHQRAIANAIKRARYMALIHYKGD